MQIRSKFVTNVRMYIHLNVQISHGGPNICGLTITPYFLLAQELIWSTLHPSGQFLMGNKPFIFKNPLNAKISSYGLCENAPFLWKAIMWFSRIGDAPTKSNILEDFNKFVELGFNSQIGRWFQHYLSQCMRLPTLWYVQPAKPQISLHIRAVWSEPLLLAWVFYDC